MIILFLYLSCTQYAILHINLLKQFTMKKMNLSQMTEVTGGSCEPVFIGICIDYIPPRPGHCFLKYLLEVSCT